MPSAEAFHLIPLPIKPSARRLPPSERSESLFIKTLEHSTAAVFATHNIYIPCAQKTSGVRDHGC